MAVTCIYTIKIITHCIKKNIFQFDNDLAVTLNHLTGIYDWYFIVSSLEMDSIFERFGLTFQEKNNYILDRVKRIWYL